MKCISTECPGKPIAKGCCDKHYRRLKKYGSLSIPVREKGLCYIKDCENMEKTRSMCIKHYSRWLKNGDASIVLRRVTKGLQYKKMPEYTVWCNMKSRCYKTSNNQYHNYGARGIAVCDDWLNNFPAFLKDMGQRPTNKHVIDRENNNEGYSPSNCRWVTNKVNCRNTRRNKYLTYKGITRSYAEWSEIIGGNYHIVSDRVKWGWDIERIIETPVRRINRT